MRAYRSLRPSASGQRLACPAIFGGSPASRSLACDGPDLAIEPGDGATGVGSLNSVTLDARCPLPSPHPLAAPLGLAESLRGHPVSRLLGTRLMKRVRLVLTSERVPGRAGWRRWAGRTNCCPLLTEGSTRGGAFVGHLSRHAAGGASRRAELPVWRDDGQVDWGGALTRDGYLRFQFRGRRWCLLTEDDALLLIAAAASPFCVRAGAVRSREPTALPILKNNPARISPSPHPALPAAAPLTRLHALRLVNRNLGHDRTRPDCSSCPCRRPRFYGIPGALEASPGEQHDATSTGQCAAAAARLEPQESA
ncbi:hypothetical protein B0J12DRAFT_775978 [Macrophomina phaseolina]|uniref:Uncharacterized protein n=1 Tax=Macrophomina phaseolina TaxID=35725 RepID=A0ABQ8GH14_9PEZI|nr:hypothetical protein B0J12DRAFT_775978 [Macrophomina phaseolina]